MALVNEHYLKLAGGYLFPEIARRIEAYAVANPETAGRTNRIIHCGIGDVTEPLPAAAIEAIHAAADELGRRETFRGYGPGNGYEFIRNSIVEHDFRGRGSPGRGRSHPWTRRRGRPPRRRYRCRDRENRARRSSHG